MFIYFLLIRIAALLGHRKAQLLVRGQRNWQQQAEVRDWVWIHVSSVGEFEQARPLIEALRAREATHHSAHTPILLTFFSPSGYELRKNYDKADKVIYLPFATRRNARLFLDLYRPKMAVFVKYEFWPAYLRQLESRHIPTYLVSAIFRSSQLFFRPWGMPYRRLLHCFTHLYVQDEASRALLQRYGINNASVAGDTRFDRVARIAAEGQPIPLIEAFTKNSEKVIIAGSTWPQDERLLVRYIDEHPDVKLVMAPHEIDEAHLRSIFQLFRGRYVRYTQANELNLLHTRVLVVDTIGMLSRIYRYGHVAYIGGGFGAGIHNTIEAAVYGIPVLFGPKYTHFREACALIEAGGGKSIKNYKTFSAAMDEMLLRHAELGLMSKGYVASELGATDKIMEIFNN